MTDKELYIRLGQRLRARRGMLELTQDEVARACDTGFRQIHKHETGAALSVSRFLKIAAALQISPADMLMALDWSPEPVEVPEAGRRR